MADPVQLTVQVDGMTCDGCARHVESALRRLAGVREVTVPTWRAGRATVIADAGVSDETLTRTFENLRDPADRDRD